MTNFNIGNIILGERVICVSPLIDTDVYNMETIISPDIIELRIDMFNDISIKGIINTFKEAHRKFKIPIIATCRSFIEGGAIPILDEQRLDIYEAILDITDALDIEINSMIAKDVIDLARHQKKTTIASFHDFNYTPDLKSLEEIHSKGRGYTCDIIKIAVTPRNYKDLRILTEFTLKYHDKGIVTIAMGKLGRPSRLFLPLIGSLFTFASLGTSSAPGQLTMKEMLEFFSH